MLCTPRESPTNFQGFYQAFEVITPICLGVLSDFTKAEWAKSLLPLLLFIVALVGRGFFGLWSFYVNVDQRLVAVHLLKTTGAPPLPIRKRDGQDRSHGYLGGHGDDDRNRYQSSARTPTALVMTAGL